MSVFNGLFTSESVSTGHPDKLCDLISDSVLDAFLARDPHSRVACETFAADTKIIVAGEFRTADRAVYDAVQGEAADIVRSGPFGAVLTDPDDIAAQLKQWLAQKQAHAGRLPDLLVACIGGGSNALGLFHPFLDDADVKMLGVEAAGHGLDGDQHAASLLGGSPGVLHGNRTYLLQDADGQITEGHSISAGLDYPGIGPEHAWLKESGRVDYTAVTDDEALEGFQLLCRTEGIIPALEPSHAIAAVAKVAPTMPKDSIVLMNLCGRGDKDIFTVAEKLGVKL
jgi:tryptophan synthase beta subunit